MSLLEYHNPTMFSSLEWNFGVGWDLTSDHSIEENFSDFRGFFTDFFGARWDLDLDLDLASSST
jgi:hypothetical protein